MAGSGTVGDAPVWMGLTQSQLDRQYDQRTLVPHVAEYVARWDMWSEETRRMHPPATLRYGPEPDALLDLYPGDDPSAPLHVHVHGGAWRIGSKDNSGFVAQGLSGSGAAVAVLGFGLAPATSLPRMAGQVRDAVAFLLRRPDAPASLTVSGHSSGAHLAALLLDPAWQKRAGLPEQGIRGAVLASGPYDLEPVRLSARNEYLSLSEADVAEFSPALHLPADPPPLRIFCGDGELLEFRRQTEAFAQRLGQPFEVLNGCNHFDVYDLFGDPASPIARAIRDMTV